MFPFQLKSQPSDDWRAATEHAYQASMASWASHEARALHSKVVTSAREHRPPEMRARSAALPAFTKETQFTAAETTRVTLSPHHRYE